MAKNSVKTRIPTAYGEFTLYLYPEQGKEHLALVKGEVGGQTGVPVRVHSECLTGDVFGSRRCDCGDQLKHTLQYLGRLPYGVLVYLRQEGRGIGLFKKLEAYNLQDAGMDTVEANLHLGHQADERDYGIAARILKSLEVGSIRLITNNPHKVDALTENGIEVEARIPIEVGQHEDNLGYLRSKAEKLAHWLTFNEQRPEQDGFAFIAPLIDQLSLARSAVEGGPFVTLAYAQCLDGGIAGQGLPVPALSRYLCAHHDALLVGADTPPPDMAHGEGEAPQLVIVDSDLRTPPGQPWPSAAQPPVIVTTGVADPARRAALVAGGAQVVVAAADPDGGVDPGDTLRLLWELGIRTLMVAGDARLIQGLFRQRRVDYCVVAIAPRFGGGFPAGGNAAGGVPTLTDCQYQVLGSDIVAYGPVGYG